MIGFSNRYFFSFLILCFHLLLHSATSCQDSPVRYPWQEESLSGPSTMVTMCVDKDWMPFEKIDEQGNHVGIAADILRLISHRSGVTFDLIPTESWEQSLEFSKKGICQSISFLNKTPEREQWLVFTEPYYEDQDVFITREEHEIVENPAELSGKTLVLPRHTHVENRIRRDFPNLELILVDSHNEALHWVNERKADMTLRSLTLAAYIIKTEGWFNLKIAGELPQYTNQLRIGISRNLIHIRDTLNAAIATLTPSEIHEITNQYVPVHVVPSYNYRLIAIITGGFTFVLLIGIFWNYQLRRFNRRLEAKQQELLLLSQKLATSAKRYKAIIAASNSGAWEYTAQTDHLWCSPQYFKMLGRSARDFDLTSHNNAEKIWKELLHPEDLPCALKYLRNFVANPSNTYETTFRMLHASGDYRWILSRGQGLKDVGGNPGLMIIGTHIDITEQKNTEEIIRQKNKELETFLYVTSHDLRSPLINIEGFSAKIKSGLQKLSNLLPEDCSQHQEFNEVSEIVNKSLPRNLSVVLSNVEKMDTLISGLLKIARTGKLKLYIEPVNMDKLIRNIRITLGFQEEQANAHYEIKPLPDCYGDQNLINQLFTNLIDNAIKYRKPHQPVSIKIDAVHDESTATYRIQDNGIGISASNQNKVWDVFYRVDDETQKGDGIGLSLAAKIVERHKGSIWVESEQGKGSTFFVRLPRN